ncbi:MAG: type II toxin-antitoxin system RelE/ParE family toxin [Candidatus Hydrogenedentes bacterium]|nr:type II toxin-antitoxin system RelE/ParE family toxin [Candidatus Hydrogenedentota bacterium]
MRIRFLETAQSELDQAVDYYNREAPGLGDAFLKEVLNAISRIGDFPDAWQRLSARARRCQTRRFPYGIIYQVRDDEIMVIAIANLHRRPEYWSDRLGGRR